MTAQQQEPERQFLGRPVGFISTAQQEVPEKLGIESPWYFTPNEHLLLFAGGGTCPGGIQRSTAVQFVCGVEHKVVRLVEGHQGFFVLGMTVASER